MAGTDNNALPTDSAKRIELLDILRGFAVFGIFVVNIEIMNCAFMNQQAFYGQWTTGIDKLATQVYHLFFYSKFFPIFSFLFGLGISMQALKQLEKNNKSLSAPDAPKQNLAAAGREAGPSAFFIRRMILLFVFGLLHVIFIWSGDVLHLYALLGLFTTLLMKRSDKLIVGLSVLLLLFPFYEQLAELVFSFLNFRPELFLEAYPAQEITRVLRSGLYLEGLRYRLFEWVSNIPLLIFYFAPIALSMFLLGLYFGKKGFVHTIDSFVEKTKKTALLTALLVNGYRLFFLYVLPHAGFDKAYRPVFLKLMHISDVVVGLFYLWLIAWLLGFSAPKKLLSPLKYVGRMALSNYIMHSLFGLLLFSSLGFQRYETLSPAGLLFTAASVFAFQLLFSRFWLSHFYYGPLEWVWRCFSYQKLFPIKRRVLPGVAQMQ